MIDLNLATFSEREIDPGVYEISCRINLSTTARVSKFEMENYVGSEQMKAEIRKRLKRMLHEMMIGKAQQRLNYLESLVQIQARNWTHIGPAFEAVRKELA